MTDYYLDSSIALRALLGHSPSAAHWLEAARIRGDRVLSSRLLQTEVLRTLRREQLPLERADRLVGDLHLVPLNNDVLEVAEGILPRVRTLDALHLATALLTRVQPVIATHDARMAAVAIELGLEVVDPV